MQTAASGRVSTIVPPLLTLGCLALAAVEVAADDWPQSTAVALVWAAAFLAPVAFLHRNPVAAWLAFTAVAVVTVPTLGVPRSGALFFANVLLLFGLGAFEPERRRLLAVQPAVVTVVAIISFFDPQKPTTADRLSEFVPTLVLFWAALGVGLVVAWRSRRAQVAQADVDLAQAESATAVQRAVAAERARIARDLHDVVAHAVSLMVVQAVGARGMLQRRPDRARSALDAIDQAGAQALEELHRMVDVLAEDRIQPRHASEAPGLATLDTLTTAARATGVEVVVHTRGPLERVPPGPDLAAYRIAQEALTNAVKHSRGPITLLIEVTATSVWVEVVNGLAAAGLEVAGGGHGLVGMRERAALYGGTLETGVRDGQWRVCAVLPVSLGVAA